MKYFEDFAKHVLACYPQEAVGYVENGIFFPLENVHPDPVNCFALCEKDSFMLLQKKYYLLHSHTMTSFKDDPRIPSEEDMKGQQATNMPWGIVHCDGENVSDILWLEKENIVQELLDREYKANITDCFTLARDFYRANFNIDFGTHPRPADWEEWNPHYINNTYDKLGFKEIKSEMPLQFGDILLFRIGSNYINHIGIFIEKDKFLHHLYQRKSSYDSIDKWQRQLVKIIRRTDASISNARQSL